MFSLLGGACNRISCLVSSSSFFKPILPFNAAFLTRSLGTARRHDYKSKCKYLLSFAQYSPIYAAIDVYSDYTPTIRFKAKKKNKSDTAIKRGDTKTLLESGIIKKGLDLPASPSDEFKKRVMLHNHLPYTKDIPTNIQPKEHTSSDSDTRQPAKRPPQPHVEEKDLSNSYREWQEKFGKHIASGGYVIPANNPKTWTGTYSWLNDVKLANEMVGVISRGESNSC